ncbi:MAG: adenine-specific DNA-methyltransferase [Acidobacteriaceae bacterium]
MLRYGPTSGLLQQRVYLSFVEVRYDGRCHRNHLGVFKDMRVFEQNGSRIIEADVFEGLEASVPDGAANLIFVDPPYNIGKIFNGKREKWGSDEEYLQWCYRWLDLCIRKLSATGSMYLMAATQNVPFLDIYLRGKLTIMSRIVWHYDSSGVQAKRIYGSMYEPILFAVKDKSNYTFNAEEIMVEARTGAVRKLIDYRKPVPTPYSNSKVPGNVWFFPRVRYRMPEYEEHPSQKPEPLLERIIRASSNEGDLVVDPFAGTFTTCAVATRLKRRFVGIEADSRYVGIGLRRATYNQSHDVTPPPKKNYKAQIALEGQHNLF